MINIHITYVYILYYYYNYYVIIIYILYILHSTKCVRLLHYKQLNILSWCDLMRILEINICLLHYNTRREFISIIIVFLKKASVLRLDTHRRLAQPWKQDRDPYQINVQQMLL